MPADTRPDDLRAEELVMEAKATRPEHLHDPDGHIIRIVPAEEDRPR